MNTGRTILVVILVGIALTCAATWVGLRLHHENADSATTQPVEEEKPAGEQGTYLHPELFGQPASKGVAAARTAEVQTGAQPGGR